jgi:hypothetical protein
MVMLELEAMGCESVKTELSAQYVDHNVLQTDFKVLIQQSRHRMIKIALLHIFLLVMNM